MRKKVKRGKSKGIIAHCLNAKSHNNLIPGDSHLEELLLDANLKDFAIFVVGIELLKMGRAGLEPAAR